MTKSTQGTIRIAVTGHRFISISHKLIAAIQEVIAHILRDYPGSDFHLLSALAEGSDQLVARIAQKHQEIKLFVPLPLPEDKYLLDFASDEGRAAFHQIITTAEKVITLRDDDDHDHAYDHLGSYLVDQCSILLSIWNGEPSNKRGSTGDVIKRAISAGKPVYWIYCENGNQDNPNQLSKRKEIGEIQVLNVNE